MLVLSSRIFGKIETVPPLGNVCKGIKTLIELVLTISVGIVFCLVMETLTSDKLMENFLLINGDSFFHYDVQKFFEN